MLFMFFRYPELKVVGSLNGKLRFLCIQNISMAEIYRKGWNFKESSEVISVTA
jgi:hypothetical protein